MFSGEKYEECIDGSIEMLRPMDAILSRFPDQHSFIVHGLYPTQIKKRILENRICVSKTIDWAVAKSACIARFSCFRLTRAAVCFYSRKTARPAAVHALAVGPAHAHRVAGGRPLCTLPAGYFFLFEN